MEKISSEDFAKNKTVKENKYLASYIEQFNSDVKLTMENLREKSLTCSAIWAKWLQFLFYEKENLEKAIKLKQEIIQKKTATNIQDSVLRLKSEEKLIANDENIKKLNLIQKNTKDNIDYIERALNILQNFGFQIKNTTDIIKITSN